MSSSPVSTNPVPVRLIVAIQSSLASAVDHPRFGMDGRVAAHTVT